MYLRSRVVHRPIVALVSTPLQLIALREYLAIQSLSFSDCAVLAVPRRARLEQMQHVAEHLGVSFGQVMVRRKWGLRGAFGPAVLEILRGTILARWMEHCTTLVLGGFLGYAEHHILARNACVRGASIVVVDDGTASIDLHRKISRGEPLLEYSGVARLAVKHCGISGHIDGRIQLFSIFPLVATERCDVTRNDLRQLRSEALSLRARYQNLFIAETLRGGLSAAEERRYFDVVKRAVGVGPWSYLRHPGETPHDALRRAKYLGMQLIEASLPLECWIAWEVGAPSRIATVTSTAGFTARILCPHVNVQFIRIGNLGPESVEITEAVYRMAKEFGAAIV